MTVAEEWMARGEEKGKQEGKQEGEARTLLHLIERKFGPEARAAYHKRVENASVAELEVWIDRILDADRVEAVFAKE